MVRTVLNIINVQVLRNGRLLKDSACQHIFVGLSMTPQERTDWFRKRQQLKATAATLPHLSQKLQRTGFALNYFQSHRGS
ncbi:hypothetical protein AAVH_10728 [Aphelenchoides avenae]|nr:hypothetical protein AAVH_10728 [Aphelenchus avenae]